MTGVSDADDRNLDEWKEARAVLGRFDDNLHDLRKYGFTFITALLAADGLLGSGSSSYDPPVKATVLVATLGLIVALRMLDKHYRLFQEAAAVRAILLERRLNLDLTDDISVYYKLQGYWRNVQALYFAFILLVGLVALGILWPSPPLFAAVLVAAIIAGLAVLYIDRQKTSALADWSVDRKIVKVGDPIRITFTDLNPGHTRPTKKDKDQPGRFVLSWWVVPEAQPNGPLTSEGETSVDRLYYLDDHDWLWETKNVEPGLYWVTMRANDPNLRKKRPTAFPKEVEVKLSTLEVTGPGDAETHNVTMTVQVVK